MGNQLITYLSVGAIYFILKSYLFSEKKKPLTRSFSIFFDTVFLNTLLLALVHLKHPSVLLIDPGIYHRHFMIKYAMAGTALTLLLLTIKAIMEGNITFERVPKKRPIWLSIMIVVCGTTGIFLTVFSKWFIDFFGQLTPEQFLFNLQSPVKGTTTDTVKLIWNGPVLQTALGSILLMAYLCFSYRVHVRFERWVPRFRLLRRLASKKAIAALCAISMLAGGAGYMVYKLNLTAVFSAYYSSSNYIQENYVDVRTVNARFPEKKRNLIHIYLESVENSYLDKSRGGFMEHNLMPELTELAKEGISFSDNDVMGGPYQTYGSGWSVASMINMSCGIPLKVAMDGNSYGLAGSFLPGCYNLGDLLHDNGYEQTVMFGADADFGGLTTFFTSHGHFNIFDYKYAAKNGFLPPDYYVWWGFEDDKLYEFAKQEILRLAGTGNPFSFTMENADTHFPHGYLSQHAPTPYADQYSNVIAYSSSEVVKLVRWIQQQDFYKNTTIVLTGDHLSMDKDFFANFDPAYRRSVFNVILNAPITTERTQNRAFAPLDFYPTIVSALGVTYDGHRLGLGTDLFSEEKTLIERDGFKLFNAELGKNSNFYNQELVNERKTH